MKKFLKTVNGRELIKTQCQVCGAEAPRGGFCQKHRRYKRCSKKNKVLGTRGSRSNYPAGTLITRGEV